VSPAELERISLDVLSANAPLLGEDEEYWIVQIVTRGPGWWNVTVAGPPSVIVFTRPIKFDRFAKFHRQGAHVATPSIRHVPPECHDPKMKHYSHIDFCLAELEARRV
jgi:hypothetical protein